MCGTELLERLEPSRHVDLVWGLVCILYAMRVASDDMLDSEIMRSLGSSSAAYRFGDDTEHQLEVAAVYGN